MNEPKGLPPRLPLPPRRVISPRRKMIIMVLLGGILLVEAVWAGVTYWKERSEKRSELVVYHVCLGSEARLCPADLTFVRDQGEDTLTKWAQRECSGYKARHIIVNDGPAKDCNCSLADITCASEY